MVSYLKLFAHPSISFMTVLGILRRFTPSMFLHSIYFIMNPSISLTVAPELFCIFANFIALDFFIYKHVDNSPSTVYCVDFVSLANANIFLIVRYMIDFVSFISVEVVQCIPSLNSMLLKILR